MHLALPLSALGIGGSLVSADFLRVGCFASDDRLALSLASFVPPAAAALGFVFSSRLVEAPRVPAWVGCATTTCATGAFLGAAMGAMLWGHAGFPMGLADGLAFGAAYAIAFALVAAAVQRTGRARPASIVDASDRLLVAAAVATLLGVAAGLTRFRRTAYPYCSTELTAAPVVALASFATVVVIVAVQAQRLVRVSTVAARVHRADDGATFLSRLPCTDFGVGDEFGAVYAVERSAYRHGPAALRLTRGDAHFARHALLQAMSLEWAMLVATLGSSALAIG
jgi:hypothetical protein